MAHASSEPWFGAPWNDQSSFALSCLTSRSTSVVLVVTTQHRVGHHVGVEGGLERRRQVAAGNAAQDLPVAVAQAGIAGPAPPAALVEELLTDAHGLHSAPGLHRRERPGGGVGTLRRA